MYILILPADKSPVTKKQSQTDVTNGMDESKVFSSTKIITFPFFDPKVQQMCLLYDGELCCGLSQLNATIREILETLSYCL